MKTPKQIAIDILWNDSDLLFDFYYERQHEDYDKGTKTEQKEISRHIGILHDRFLKMLQKARGRKN